MSVAPLSTPPLRLVFWELTARCNLRCRHCRGEAGENPAADELGTRDILQAADDIRAAGDPILILTGGEPLTRPDFFTVAEACAKRFSRVALATNGTLVDDTTARRIVASGIQRVSVSIDGADAATHDRFRGQGGSFDAALRGYAALRRAGMSMQINVTVAHHNESQLEDLLTLSLALGADAFHVFMLVPVGCGADIAPRERLEADRVEQALTWLFKRAGDLEGTLQIKATCAPQFHRIMRQAGTAPGTTAATGEHGMHTVTRGCLAGSSVCFVSRCGDVQPCGYLPVKAGNLRRRPFVDIWRSAPVFQTLRDPGQLKGKCGVCAYRLVCQGCRARAYAKTGDFLEADPDCPYQPSGTGAVSEPARGAGEGQQ
ncbi:MAG: radical SAM protein [Lentisphaeria bacterium]|nr:radical SAM protein [Lentisphaeria bacterium]